MLIQQKRLDSVEWDEKTVMNSEDVRIWSEATVVYVKKIKTCLSKTYDCNNSSSIGEHLSDTFDIQNGLKQGFVYRRCFQFNLEKAIRKV
jgi:hypothetical protein